MSFLGSILGGIAGAIDPQADPTTLYTPTVDDDGNRLYTMSGKEDEEELYIIAQVAYLYTCRYLTRDDIDHFIKTGQLLVHRQQVVYVENKQKEKVKTSVTVPESAFAQPTRQVQSGKVDNQEILHLCDIDIGRLDKASRKKLQWHGVLFSWAREYGNFVPDANSIRFMSPQESKTYVAIDDELRHAFHVQGYKDVELKDLGLTPKKAAPKAAAEQTETPTEIQKREKCLQEVDKHKDEAKVHVKCAANLAAACQLLQENYDYGYAVKQVCNSKSTEGSLADVLPSILAIWLPDPEHQKIVLDAAHEAMIKHNEAEAKKAKDKEAEKTDKTDKDDKKSDKKPQPKRGGRGNTSDKQKTKPQPGTDGGSPTTSSKDVVDFEIDTPIEEKPVSVDKAVKVISERLKNDEEKLDAFLRDMGVYMGKAIETLPFGELREIASKYGVALKVVEE